MRQKYEPRSYVARNERVSWSVTKYLFPVGTVMSDDAHYRVGESEATVV